MTPTDKGGLMHRSPTPTLAGSCPRPGRRPATCRGLYTIAPHSRPRPRKDGKTGKIVPVGLSHRHGTCCTVRRRRRIIARTKATRDATRAFSKHKHDTGADSRPVPPLSAPLPQSHGNDGCCCCPLLLLQQLLHAGCCHHVLLPTSTHGPPRRSNVRICRGCCTVHS